MNSQSVMKGKVSASPYHGMTLEDMADLKRRNRMAAFDAYDPAIRALIHEYGMNVVKAIYDLGIRKPNHIKHIVETVLNEFSPTRGTYSSQGVKAIVGAHPSAAKIEDEQR